MHTVHFDPVRGELTIRLDAPHTAQARQHFLSIGHALSQFCDRRLACVGTAILAGVNGPGVKPRPCWFCGRDGLECCRVIPTATATQADGPASARTTRPSRSTSGS